MKQTAKDVLNKGLGELNELFKSSFVINSNISIEVEPSDIEIYQKVLAIQKSTKPESNVHIKYDLETKSLEISSTPYDLYTFGYCHGAYMTSLSVTKTKTE